MLALPYDCISRMGLNLAFFRRCVYERNTLYSLDNMEHSTNCTINNVLLHEEVNN